jgi:hypothetical protein
MFDLDDFIVSCLEARAESDPRRAVRELLERALRSPGEVADALAPKEAGFSLLHHADDLTVLHVVWAPKMDIYPHDHRMWAAIGIYAGAGQRLLPAPGTRRADAHPVRRQAARRRRHRTARRRHDPRRHQPQRRAHGRDPRLWRRLRQPTPQPVGTRTGRGAPVRHRGRSPAVRRRQRRLACGGSVDAFGGRDRHPRP